MNKWLDLWPHRLRADWASIRARGFLSFLRRGALRLFPLFAFISWGGLLSTDRPIALSAIRIAVLILLPVVATLLWAAVTWLDCERDWRRQNPS